MKLNQNYTLKVVAGENMIIDMTSDNLRMERILSVNEPTAWLWKKIGRQEFDEPLLVDWICSEYDVCRETAEKDVHNVILIFNRFGILQ